jgi:predicted O-methyltransferase YrrM
MTARTLTTDAPWRAGDAPRETPETHRPAGREEAAIDTVQANVAYVEEFFSEDDAVRAARRRGHEVGLTPVGPAAGAALRFVATAIGARTVVEIGSGCGVSGIWLLRGMRPDGVLTSVDLEPEHQRLARQAFAEAGFPTSRTRLIAGRALDVLPRLTDGAYDMVFCDADKQEYPEYLAEAMRLLRPKGVVAFGNALWNERAAVGDQSRRGQDTVVIRELGKQIREDERLISMLLPVSDGLLCALKHDQQV